MGTLDKITMTTQEKITAGEDALKRSAYQEAENFFAEALTDPEISLDNECSVRCSWAKSLENHTKYRDALKVLSKYETSGLKDMLPQALRGEVNLRLGWSYSWLGEHPKAIALLNQALKDFKDVGQESGIGEAYHALGRTYIVEIEEYKIARDHLTEALEYQRRAGDPYALAQTYLRLGLVEYQEGNLNSAKASFLEAASLAEGSTDHTMQGALHINLAAVFYDQCEAEDAAHSYELAINHLTKVGHKRLLGVAYGNLGKSLMRLGKWTEAQKALEQGLALTHEVNNRRDEAIILQNLGNLQYYREEYPQAEKSLRTSIELLTQLKNKTYLAESCRCLALVSGALGNYNEAFDYAKRSLQLTINAKAGRHAASSYLVLSELHLERKEYRTAEDFLKMAKAKLEKQSDLELAGYAQRLMGKLHFAMGDTIDARLAIDQSISLFKTTKSRYQAALSQLELGRVLVKLNDIAMAETHLESAERSFADLGVAGLRRISADLLLQLPRKISSPTETATTLMPFESVLVERLVDAANQRELLLRELTSITRDLFAADSVVIFEVGETGDFNPVVNHGPLSSNLTRLYERIRLQLDGGRPISPETILRTFSDRSQKNYLIYIAAKHTPDQRRLGQMQALIRLAEQSLEINTLREKIKTTKEFDASNLRCLSSMPGFLVVSPTMKTVLEQIHKIRSSNVTVLITGESGTGKELIARAIHLESERRERDFVPFNCAAVAKDIVESRLFGHRRGAFTGASHDQRGIIRAAEGGTLFLDEVGELPIDIQPKLLRFLQEGEIHALGDDRPQRVNVRVLAATNRDLEKQVAKGLFREDLFHRLNVIRIQVPPLKARREEILPLAENFLKTFSERMGKSVRLSEEAADKLVAYDWPGNVRQLQNEIERVVAYAEEKHIVTIDEISAEIANFRRTTVFYEQNSTPGRIPVPRGVTLADAVDALERQMVSEALKRNNNNISRTARQLGLTRKGLQLKRSRLGL